MKRAKHRSIAAAILLLGLSGCGRDGGGSADAPQAKLYQGKAFGAWLLDLEEARGEARLRAVRAIGAMGPEQRRDAKGAVPALLAAFEERSCRAAAALSLGSLGPEARVAVPALVGALRDEEQEVRTSAAAALEKIGPDAIPHLVAAVESREDRPPFYGEQGTWFDELVRVKPQYVAVGLVVIALAALAVLYQSFKLWIRHRERLTRLEKGLPPDASPSPGSEPVARRSEIGERRKE